MRSSWWSALYVAAAFCATAQPCIAQDITLANPGFEDGQPGETPPGWSFGGSEGYRAAISADAAHTGEQGVVITSSAGDVTSPNSFSSLTHGADATALRGHRIRLQAAVQLEVEPGATTELWVRSDAAPGEMLILVNSGARRTPSGDWTDFDLVVPVHENAASISFGFLFRGRGTVRIDDFSLVDIGPTNWGPAWGYIPPSALTDDGVANLTAFARLYGVVRFFHPSDEAAGADWHDVALAGIERAEGAADADELRQALTEVFAPLAPTLRIVDAGAPAPSLDLSGAAEVIAWRRVGLGQEPGGIYRGERIEAPADLPDMARFDLPRGLAAYVPLKVARAADGSTLPSAEAAVVTSTKPEGFTPNGRDRTSRLASVVITWNVFQHFYPYWDAVDVDWAAQLPVALREAAESVDEESFDATLERLVAASQDGHGSVGRTFSRALPLQWAWIEGALVITAVDPGNTDDNQASEIRVGDIVTAIDGRPVEELLAEMEARSAAATPGFRRYKALRQLTLGPADTTRVLSLERENAGAVEASVVVSAPAGSPLQEVRPEVVAELEPGVLYVDLTRLDEERWTSELARIASAPALVFDMRGYPPSTAPIELLRHLTDEPATSAMFGRPTFRQPDQSSVVFDYSGSWFMPPLEPRFAAERVAFLTSEYAVSYAESIMGIVEAYRLGEIVGSTTAGTNGNIDRYQLPTGHGLVWTGMQVLKHDGSQHHGVGILPTLPVERTIAGVRDGRDEVLEAALAAALRPH